MPYAKHVRVSSTDTMVTHVEHVEVVEQGSTSVLVEVDGARMWVPHRSIAVESDVDAASEVGDCGTLVVESAALLEAALKGVLS